MDRISSLPDDIVCHILSFLWTKEAALTTLLSKRWRDMFAFTPNLRFKEYDFVNFDSLGSFIDFLDRVLAVSNNFPVKKFSLKHLEGIGSEDTYRWIRNVLSRGVLVRLHLDLNPKGQFDAPLEIFTCKTLVKLKLGIMFFIESVPENASLPALKTLFLDTIMFYDDHIFKNLLSACPVLEELVINCVMTKDGELCGTVSSPTLQRLTMNYQPLCGHSRYNSKRVTFDTPSLAYLEYYDIVVEAYPIINLDSLVEAKLDLKLWPALIHSSQGNLIKGLRNVQILNLSTLETMETIYSFREAIPVFKNLYHLSITTKSNKCCRTLPFLVKNSPNLQTLVIKGPLHYDEHGEEPDAVCECMSGYSYLLSCRLKVLEITSYGGTIFELAQLKHFLEKLPCLELVKVRSSAKNKKRLIIDLQNLLRSSKCKKFEFRSP